MADPYIDQYETIAYGKFAVGQILALVVGLDSDADSFIKTAAARLLSDTEAMWTALSKVGSLEVVTYTAQESAAVLANSRQTLRRLVAYAESRVNGDAIVRDILNGETLSVTLRRRPVKLAAALEHALAAIKKHAASLPEHAQWTQDVTAAHNALADLNGSVRQARTDRRSMTPEVEVARNTWMRRYAATKLIIRGILEPLGKADMMPEIFDDLAEVHRAQGVRDEEAPEAPPA
ncbi:MAG: hypothetical protein IPM54_35440 [Polyangiaceae bacterium]|nr:hypothetical protein [Polyangiaceae bacterium]